MKARDLFTLGVCQPSLDLFQDRQKEASAFAGFDLSKPADLSALNVDFVTSQTNKDEDGGLSFHLTTRVRGWVSGEFSEEEIIITIERKNVKKMPNVKRPNS